MAHTVHNPKVFYAAILARLVASTGKQAELGIAPEVPVLPYSVVYPLNDDETDGSLSDPTQAVWWLWQVTAVSDSGAGAQLMQYRVRQALQGFIPTVAGVGTTPIELADGSGLDRDDRVQPTLFFTTDRYTALTSI